MQITVKLFASYRIGRFKEAVREYPTGTLIADVLQSLNIGEMRGVVLVNGRPVPLDQELRESDTMTLLPLISGG
jgi:sulfur carrier protein ThiS